MAMASEGIPSNAWQDGGAAAANVNLNATVSPACAGHALHDHLRRLGAKLEDRATFVTRADVDDTAALHADVYRCSADPDGRIEGEVAEHLRRLRAARKELAKDVACPYPDGEVTPVDTDEAGLTKMERDVSEQATRTADGAERFHEGSGAPVPSSQYASYADALRSRLARVTEELENQARSALSLRRSVEIMEEETADNRREIVRLRQKWIAGQPRREAYLQEVGTLEARLAHRERQFAEAVAIHTVDASLADAAQPAVGGGRSTVESTVGTPSARPRSAGTVRGGASCDGCDASVRPVTSAPAVSSTAVPVTDGSVNHESDGPVSTVLVGACSLHELRTRLRSLEKSRVNLTAAQRDLQDSSRQEAAGMAQFAARGAALRQEKNAIIPGTAAAQENEGKARKRVEIVSACIINTQHRTQILERQVAALLAEIDGLKLDILTCSSQQSVRIGGAERGRLLAPSTARGTSPTTLLPTRVSIGGNECCGTTLGPALGIDAAGELVLPLAETNRRLHEKVARLQEEFMMRREGVLRLREQVVVAAAAT